jgi:hypothetical protein
MAEGNSILSTNTEDIDRVNALVASNSVSNLRIALAKTQRRIMVMENRIVELANNEQVIKARIYANVDQSFINTKYAAGIDQQVDPVQSYSRTTVSQDPDPSLTSNKFTAYSTVTGVTELDAELNRINAELNTARQILRRYQRDQTDLTVALTTAQQKQSQNIFNKIGQAISPSPDDLAKDQIAKARLSNLLLLQGMCTVYRSFTTNPTTQQPGFPDEVKLPETLLNIRLKFWATANAFHDPISSDVAGVTTAINFIDPKSPSKLNFDNPGLIANQVILDSKVSLFRVAGKNNKLSADVSQFIKDNLAVTNDALVSAGIDRKPSPVAVPSNSMLAQTKSYPAVALALGDQYIGSFEIPNINDSIRKWWKKKNATFSSLPLCPNIPKPSLTITDTNETSAAIKYQNAIKNGANLFTEALSVAAAAQQNINMLRLSDLPSDAPGWVQLFTVTYFGTTYNDYIGSITLPDSQNFNRTYIVSRAVNANQATAINQAKTVPYTSKKPNSTSQNPPTTSPINQIATLSTQYGFQLKGGNFVVFILWVPTTDAQ